MPVRFAERRIAVDLAAIAFADNEFGLRDREGRRELGTRRSLNAVIWPKHLRPVGQLDRLERSAPRVARCEGEVPGYVPVLRQRGMRENPCQRVHHRHDCVPLRDGERAAGQKIVLHVDNEEEIAVRHPRRHRAHSEIESIPRRFIVRFPEKSLHIQPDAMHVGRSRSSSYEGVRNSYS